MGDYIQVCKDVSNLPAELRATRVDNRDGMPSGAEIIGRNSPIAVARRGDDNFDNPEIDGHIVSYFKDPLSEEEVAAAPRLSSREEGMGGPNPVSDSRVKSVAMGANVVVTAAAQAVKTATVTPVARPIRTAGDRSRPQPTGSSQFVPVGQEPEQASAPVAAVPVVAAPRVRIPVQIDNPGFGILRVKADFVSISGTVVALGYIQNGETMAYEPPALGGAQLLGVTIGEHNYQCASMGISFEAEVPGILEKVLWVVLVIAS